MTIIPYLLYLWLIALHMVVLRDATAVFGVTLNLPALIVLAVAIYKQDTVAAWFGFFAGLVAAAGGPPEQLGWQALAMSLLALAACRVRERLNLDSLKAKLLMIIGGVLIHNLVSLILSRADAFLIHLVDYVVVGAVYTTVLAWLFLLVKEQRITVEKIKAIF